MKIILVTPLLDHGGGQRFVTELANYWANLNHDITIILLRSGDSFYPLSDKVTIRELGYLHQTGNSKLIKLSSGLKTLFNLRREIKKIQPDFVLSILSTTNIFTILATRNLKVRVYINDIMSPFRERPNVEKKLRKILYKRANGIIALTNVAKDTIFEETKSKNITVIPNPVKEIVIDKSIKKEKIILNVGRLHGTKGQKYLLEICSKLNRPDWKFVILGEGELRSDLELQAKKLNITDRIYMPGAVKNIDEWLSRASIFAFTSISESWGLALSEAMVAGLPSVSFDCDVGPREMIKDGENGFLVPVENTDLFTERLRQLIKDEELRIKFSTNAKIDSKRFRIEKIGNEILEFCTKL